MNDQDAIARCVLDYYEGWFQADAVRMERALHPVLAKRSLDESAGDRVETISAQQMVQATAAGRGKRLNPEDAGIEFHVDDVYDRIATVTARSAVYVDYLQLVKTSDGWKIANALWEWTPEGLELRKAALANAQA